jgi:hypothetical protein
MNVLRTGNKNVEKLYLLLLNINKFKKNIAVINKRNNNLKIKGFLNVNKTSKNVTIQSIKVEKIK